MFDPLTVTAAVVAWKVFSNKAESNFGVLTPEREDLYNNAMEHLKLPAKLLELADAYEKGGLKVHAKMLRLRAAWRNRSPELRAKHEELFKKAMASENVSGIVQVANAFQAMTATIKANKLFEHAREVQTKKAAQSADMNIHNGKSETVPAPAPEAESDNDSE